MASNSWRTVALHSSAVRSSRPAQCPSNHREECERGGRSHPEAVTALPFSLPEPGSGRGSATHAWCERPDLQQRLQPAGDRTKLREGAGSAALLLLFFLPVSRPSRGGTSGEGQRPWRGGGRSGRVSAHAQSRSRLPKVLEGEKLAGQGLTAAWSFPGISFHVAESPSFLAHALGGSG